MIHFLPTKAEFAKLADGVSVVPVYCSMLSDRLTPVSAFERLACDAEHAFLLESVIGGEKIARYSFLGSHPFALVQATSDRTTVTLRDRRTEHDGVDPLEKLEALLADYRAPHPAELPRFLGGAVGYAGYDLVRCYERLDAPPPDDRHIPVLQFGVYDQMAIFDHVRKLVHVVVHAPVGHGVDLDASYAHACSRIEAVIERLTDLRKDVIRPHLPAPPLAVPCESNMTPEQFEAAVDQCKEYIRAGDIFQVVLAQRFSATTSVPSFDVYRALRVINPSPFMFYVKTPSVTLVGASPEILCRLEGRTVSTRPLAGTRPRGRNEAEDLGLETELLADPKERAEHVMLVDLGRNDLARVCEPGEVRINELMNVERYSHVMHICSNVSGPLGEGKTGFDALRSVLPVGTVSGAPKIRAMQIIDELETVRRGPYAGAVGYVDFAGNMDTCIALRTLVITPRPDGSQCVDVQVGAGIVADSEPSGEYRETINKARAMLGALHLAHAWQEG